MNKTFGESDTAANENGVKVESGGSCGHLIFITVAYGGWLTRLLHLDGPFGVGCCSERQWSNARHLGVELHQVNV